MTCALALSGVAVTLLVGYFLIFEFCLLCGSVLVLRSRCGTIIRCTRETVLVALDSAPHSPRYCSWLRLFISRIGEGILNLWWIFWTILSSRSEKSRYRVGPKSWFKKRLLHAEISLASEASRVKTTHQGYLEAGDLLKSGCGLEL